MNMPLFLGLFFALSTIYLIIGYIASKKIKTATDYFLAKRNLGLMPVTLTLVATQLGGGMLLATSQGAYTMGIYSIVYTLGIIIGFFLLAGGFAARMRAANVATTAELFEKKYHSPGLKKIASLLSIAALFGILIAQVVASRTVLVSVGVENVALFIAFWVFIIAYTMIGGLSAVVATDIVQVLFILVLFGGLFAYALMGNPGSLSALFSNGGGTFTPGAMSSLSKILIFPALFTLIEQDLAQRFFSAKNKQIASMSALLSGVILLLFALIPIYFGMQAKLLNIDIAPGASPLIPVIEFLTNGFVATIALCAIAAAVTSTADSLLCAVSSNLAQDFDFSFIGIKNKLRIAQLLTLLTGIGAVVASFFVPLNIIDILVTSYEIAVSCLLVPLLVAYYKDDLNKYAAGSAMIAGLFGFFISRWYPIPMLNDFVPIILSAVGYIIGNQIKLKK